MTAIPFPALSTPGRTGQETGGRLINCYVVEIKGAPANPVLWQRSPGLRRIVEITDHSGCRGLITIGSTLLHILGGQVYSVIRSGTTFTATALGALAGTAPVTVAKNNAVTPNVVAVTENGVFNLFASSAPIAFADGDLPAVNSVTQIDGYLIFSTAGGQIWATGLNNVSVATNSLEGLPEGQLYRVIEYNNELFAFGNWGFRVYRNAGLSPFPLEYAGIKRDVGIAGTHAIAGDAEGFADALIWVGADRRVYRLEGYTPTPISNSHVSRSLEAADPTTLQAEVYMAEGDAFWSVTSPSQFTWDYNLTTGLWNERKSYGRNEWRARRTIREFDRWIAGDLLTGDLFEVAPAYGFERDDPHVYELYSGLISAAPNRLNAKQSWFSFTSGLGVAAGIDPIETDPRVDIRLSRNGGASWGPWKSRGLGKEGDFDKVVRIGNGGRTSPKGLQYHLRISDPVHASFIGGEADLEVFAA